MDDSAVALLSDEGLFVVTGCGHAGIVNTLEHAKSVKGENKILGIMGGFHLKQIDWQTEKPISYLKKHHVKYVYPSHCIAIPSLAAFYDNFNGRQLMTGDVVGVE